MKAAFSIWEDRIATVFDCSRLFHVARIEDGRLIGESRVSLQANLPVQRAVGLSDMGVNVLVCGAISREFYSLIAARQIDVIPFVAGPLVEVVNAFVTGTLENGDFLMPGCYRHGRHGFMTTDELAAFRFQGCNKGNQKAGPQGLCVCTRCDFKTPHQRGVPCRTLVCPMCGAPMSREG